MNFLIRFSLRGFIDGLATGSTVYGIAFTETRADKAEGYVLLTSDAGTEGGTIHALRIAIEVNGTDALAVASEADDKIIELLHLKGMKWRQGVLLTEGLQDAIRFYSSSGPYSIKQLEGWLALEKEGKEAKHKEKVTEEKMDKINE